MKNHMLFLLLFLAVILVGDSFRIQAKKESPRYKLVFRDEFNLPDGSQPDSAKCGVGAQVPQSFELVGDR